MTKLIAECVGPTQLIRPAGSEETIPYGRSAVVTGSHLIRTKIADGAIRVLKDDLPDTANDADWAAALEEAEGDVDLALAAYDPPAEPEPVTDDDKAKARKDRSTTGGAPKPKADGETYKNPSTASDLKA